jgi:hypothetical protein
MCVLLIYIEKDTIKPTHAVTSIKQLPETDFQLQIYLLHFRAECSDVYHRPVSFLIKNKLFWGITVKPVLRGNIWDKGKTYS